MKSTTSFSTVFLALVVFAIPSILAQSSTQTLSYDTNYDNANLPLSSVACSDGANGLESKGYTTLGSLPAFPYVGGVYTVTGWNSSACGTCYAVTYGSNTINVLAVDVSKTGLTVSEETMNALTDDEAVALGRIDVQVVQVNATACDMPA